MNSVRLIKSELINLRTRKKFADIFKEVQKISDDLGLEYINFSRKGKALRRYQGSELAEQLYSNAEDYYRVQFYLAIDVALACLNDYFDFSDLNEYNKLSKTLISGILDRDAIKDYLELCDSALDIELQRHVRHYKTPCLAEHLKVFRDMEPNVRCMFPAVEKLLRLLLISPASSCEAERSFSALRRLKTWLRSTMTQVAYV